MQTNLVKRGCAEEAVASTAVCRVVTSLVISSVVGTTEYSPIIVFCTTCVSD